MNHILSRYWRLGVPAILLFASCGGNNVNPTPERVDGWAPVYTTNATATTIEAASPRNIENGGKIYVKGKLLYQVEPGKGVHVTDIGTPSSPQKQSFISIMGVQEMAIKDNYMYANNLNDLVVIDLGTNGASAKEVNRMQQVFHLVDQAYPPEAGYFECIDATKGTVVGWEQKSLSKPKCRRD